MTQNPVSVREGGFDFLVSSRGMRRVVDTPVRSHHRAEIRRARFAGGIRAHGDDHIRNLREVLPRFAVQTVHGDAFTFQERERTRVDLPGRLTACTHGFPALWGQVIKGRLGQDGTAGVAGT